MKFVKKFLKRFKHEIWVMLLFQSIWLIAYAAGTPGDQWVQSSIGALLLGFWYAFEFLEGRTDDY